MGMLTFSDDPPKVYEIPRLEDHLIDDLFYQEDEIGEMRHAAFMIECGLEEDPPDGPDVPPIPWKMTPGAQLATGSQNILKSPTKQARDLPSRSSSMDDLEDLEEELAPKHTQPRRERPKRTCKIAASRTKSGTFHGMRKMPVKTHSADSLEDKKEDSPKKPKKLVTAKSGSLHGMREAARKAKETEDGTTSPGQSPLRRRKLVATKSGTLHGLRKAATDPVEDKPNSPTRASKLVATKSGTLHGMREAAKKAGKSENNDEPPKPLRRKLKSTSTDSQNNLPKPLRRRLKSTGPDSKDDPPKTTRRDSGNSLRVSQVKGSSHQLRKRTKANKSSSNDTSESGSDSLSDFAGSGSDVASDVSLDTDEDVPKSPTKSPTKSGSWWSMKNDKDERKAKEKEPEESPAERKRVFRNGKLVFDDVGESSSKPTGADSSVERLHNGNRSPSDQLRNVQSGKRTSIPQKRTSVAQMGVPSLFQNSGAPATSQQRPAMRTRPGKVKIPMKAKSISAIDIPPAFRTGGGGK